MFSRASALIIHVPFRFPVNQSRRLFYKMASPGMDFVQHSMLKIFISNRLNFLQVHYMFMLNVLMVGNFLHFNDVKAADLSIMTDSVIKSSRVVYDRVAALSENAVNYNSVLKVFL